MAAPLKIGPVLIVEKKFAQFTRSLLEDEGFLDNTKRLQSVENNKIAIPIKNELVAMLKPNAFTSQPKEHTLENNFGFQASNGHKCMSIATNHANSEENTDLDKNAHASLSVNGLQFLNSISYELGQLALLPSKKALIKKPYEKLLLALKEIWTRTECGRAWTQELERDIPSSWEQHGDMIILPNGCFSLTEWTYMGSQLWATVIKALGGSRLARRGNIFCDKFRSPQVELLYGQSAWVEHVDNGIRYTFDVTKCMFSAGNITEKLRVAKLNCLGETVVDLYAGVGYFTLPYLVHAGAQHVHACEWNPHAVLALRRNLELNHVHGRCTVYEGDNRQLCPHGIADRVNLGLIPSSEPGWSAACAALKPESGGILHIHSNVTSRTALKNDITRNNEGGCFQLHSSLQKLCEHGENDVPLKLREESCSSHKGGSRYPSPGETLQKAEMASKSYIKPAWREWSEEVSLRIRDLLLASHGRKWWTDILHVEHVKSYAPHVDHLVLDLLCKPLN